MSRSIANLKIILGADSVEVDRMMGKVRKNFQSMSKDLTAFGKKFSTYVTAPLAAAAVVSVKNADVQMQAEAKLLKALNGRADIQKRLIAQAGELQSKSTIGDETIIKQQAFFATLGLTEEQIKKCTAVAVDMSYALEDQGMSFEMASKSLAAMYGGSSGRLGQLVPELKNISAAGLKAGEGIDLLAKKFKGTAETVSGVGLNPFKQMMAALGDLSEQIGFILIPFIQKASIALKGMIEYVQKLPPSIKSGVVAISGIAAAIGPVLLLLPKLAAGFMALLSPIGLVVAALTSLGVAYAYVKVQKQALIDSLKNEKTIDELKSDLEKVRAELDKTTGWEKFLSHQVFNPSPVPSATRLLIEQEKLLVEAIKQKEREEANAAKAEAEANEAAKKQLKELLVQQQKLAEEFAGGKTAAAAGSIKQLQKELNDLQEAYDAAATSAERYRIAAQMQGVQKALDMAQSDGTGTVARPDGMNERFGQSLASVGPVRLDPSVLIGSRESWLNAERGLQANLQGFSDRAMEFIEQFNQTLTSGLQGLALSLAEGIGEAFGGEGIEALGDNIVRSVGNLIATLGSLLMTYAMMMQEFKVAMDSVFAHPVAALAVGAAMVIAGKAMAAAINKRAEKGVALADGGLAFGPTMALVGDNRGAGSDPEVIAPLSKLRQYGLGGGGTMRLAGKFVVSGSDLLLVLDREKSRQERING